MRALTRAHRGADRTVFSCQHHRRTLLAQIARDRGHGRHVVLGLQIDKAYLGRDRLARRRLRTNREQIDTHAARNEARQQVEHHALHAASAGK
jgi:hypothetical protein